MQPVWVLSVDLQTKTATFQSGLADAAKSARGAFTDIKKGAGDMGRETGVNMMEARHGVMMLGEEFGVHLPRALTSFIASIGPVGAAMEAAFPFLAIAVGATMLIEHLVKMHEAGEQLTLDQMRFGTAVNVAFNSLDDKLIQAQIKADELRNDHLGALHHQLELIDHASMEDLLKSFESLAKAGDVVMKELEGHWYSFGQGSEGAKHALEEFQVKYAVLQAKGDANGMSGLLTGTLGQAQKVLSLLQTVSQHTTGMEKDGDAEKNAAAFAAQQKLHDMGVKTGLSLKAQIEAQQNLVDILNAQVSVQERSAAIKKLEEDNATKTVGNTASAQRAAGDKAAVDSHLRLGELGLAADRALAQAQLSINRATIAQRLESDFDFAKRDYQLKVDANQAEIAALDKNGKDYHNQLKALQDKSVELTAQFATQTTELKSKAAVDSNALDLQNLEQGEREKIEFTQQASAARLAAIDAAIQLEQSKGLQDTNFFRGLLTERVALTRQMEEDTARLNEQAGRNAADNILRTGALNLARMRQNWAVEDSARNMTDERRAEEERTAANVDFQIKMEAIAKERSALDTAGKDFANKQKQSTTKKSNSLNSMKTS